MMCKLILASSSSRRRSLLKQLNLSYRVCVPDIDEKPMLGESPTDYVSRIARNKAIEVFEKTTAQHHVLAADTIIALNGEILGKPKNTLDAKSMLQKLSGNEHQVLTAVCLKNKENIYAAMETTSVTFRTISMTEIDAYCATDEPYDKAGAYAIQGLACSFVEYISGSYTNVMGLPLTMVSNLMAQAKISQHEQE